MENYIVRIYRRDATDPYKVAGVFESVEEESESTFNHLDSLVSLLVSEHGDSRTGDETPLPATATALTD